MPRLYIKLGLALWYLTINHVLSSALIIHSEAHLRHLVFIVTVAAIAPPGFFVPAHALKNLWNVSIVAGLSAVLFVHPVRVRNP